VTGEDQGRVDVFFYGLFMDAGLLRSKGVAPGRAEVATADDFRLVIGRRATIVPAAGDRVHGLVTTLTAAELTSLYSEPGLDEYVPETIRVRAGFGDPTSVVCYVLRNPPGPDERNPEYAAKLRDLAQRLGLPTDYVASIG
jgi:hypothetical protein